VVSNSVSQRFSSQNPLLPASAPSVLMAGYRAAGWACFAAAAVAMLIAAFGLRGMDILNPVTEAGEVMEMETRDSGLEIAKGRTDSAA
jgi:hypothetical protein